MIEIVSLLGTSYSGKSTLAEGLVADLAEDDIPADVIKKDEALKVLGRERYGEDDASGGYSIKGFLKHGQIPSSELHAWMNTQIKSSLALGRIAILEGGTRTRTAQAETLKDIELDEDGLRIFMLQLPFREVIRRVRKRREEAKRYDDQLLIALAKLYSQYKGLRSDDVPKIGDADVVGLDATLPPAQLVKIVSGHITESRKI